MILCSVLDILLMFFNTTLISAKSNNIVEVLDGYEEFHSAEGHGLLLNS